MDKDRIAGSAKQLKSTAKEIAGKAVGDAKLQAEGKADKVEGKVQNAVGGVKDDLSEGNGDPHEICVTMAAGVPIPILIIAWLFFR